MIIRSKLFEARYVSEHTLDSMSGKPLSLDGERVGEVLSYTIEEDGWVHIKCDVNDDVADKIRALWGATADADA